MLISPISGGADSDGDGIPDVGEFAIGTNPNIIDSDGDGISDSAELEQGLNPNDGSGFPTGEIANLGLPGNAQGVAVEEDIVYVATGSHGLAIVDASQFDNPILLGQIDLSGTATEVGVDASLGIAAVATGSSLQIVDVSDPMMPELIRSVTVGATRVEVFDGLAYANAGTTLSVVDLLTGTVLQNLPLPGTGSVTGLAREGTTLYSFVSGSDTFATIDITVEEAAAVLGQINVSVASSDVGVFTGNGVAWLAGSGLRTIDVSNPAAPLLIHGADSFFTARRVALNGSGLAALAPDGNAFLEIYDVRDPNNTNNRLLQFPLSAGVRDVAISRGFAYVTTNTGLSVVNYIPFDNQGQPPTLSATSTVSDEDPGTPGIQVTEGGNLPILVQVSDDVQVRAVDLIVDGNVIATDVSFPFDFAAPALINESVASLSVQVRATDTGGNSALSDPLFFEVVPDTFPPTIVSIDPADGAATFEGRDRIRIRFSEPLSLDSTVASNFQLVGAGLDEVFDTADDVPIDISSIQLRSNDSIIQLTTNPLAIGSYRLGVDQSGIVDRAGNPLGNGTLFTSFTVNEFVTSPEFLPFGTAVSLSDDQTIDIGPMPFPFEFFGALVSGSMFLRSNGTIEFGGSPIGGFDNFPLPIGSRVLAAPYFDDINPGAGGSVGVFDGDAVRAITWQAVPYFGRTGTVSFQVAFHANGIVEVRYGDMATPPGGTVDAGISVGTATIGLSSGGIAAMPSLGRIANKPDVAITDSGGILNATGLAALDELPGNDVLVFTPDGSGNYTIIHNFGVISNALEFAVQSDLETLNAYGEVFEELRFSPRFLHSYDVNVVFEKVPFTTLLDNVSFFRPAGQWVNDLQQIRDHQALSAGQLSIVNTADYHAGNERSREVAIDRLLASSEEMDDLFGDLCGDLTDVITLV